MGMTQKELAAKIGVQEQQIQGFAGEDFGGIGRFSLGMP
jgi:ribosome-binding protein aMBF1 (putative translation factor)